MKNSWELNLICCQQLHGFASWNTSAQSFPSKEKVPEPLHAQLIFFFYCSYYISVQLLYKLIIFPFTSLSLILPYISGRAKCIPFHVNIFPSGPMLQKGQYRPVCVLPCVVAPLSGCCRAMNCTLLPLSLSPAHWITDD